MTKFLQILDWIKLSNDCRICINKIRIFFISCSRKFGFHAYKFTNWINSYKRITRTQTRSTKCGGREKKTRMLKIYTNVRHSKASKRVGQSGKYFPLRVESTNFTVHQLTSQEKGLHEIGKLQEMILLGAKNWC